MKELLTNMISNLLVNEEGQGMVEYGLILALIAVAAITVLGLIGTDITAKFTEVDNQLK